MNTHIRCAVALLALGLLSSAAQESLTAQVQAKPVFLSAIGWTGTEEPANAESKALLDAIGVFEAAGIRAGFDALERYLRAYPNSAWSASLHSHIAERYRAASRHSEALAHWKAAWELVEHDDSEAARSIAATTLAGWTRILGSLGRKDEMDRLFAEAAARGLDTGLMAPKIQATKEGLAIMKGDPGRSYRCGSFALGHVLEILGEDRGLVQPFFDAPSPDGGFTMSQLLALAASNGVPVVAARRLEGDVVPVPSVVHWKLDHYAAVLEKSGSRYRLVDPTFGRARWVEADVVNNEVSGNFLLVRTALPDGWRRLSPEETDRIRGKGYPNVIDDWEDTNEDPDPCPPPPPPDAGDGPQGEGEPCPPPPPAKQAAIAGDSSGMAVWRISEPYTTVWIDDTPLYYKSSSGNWINLTLSYKHRSTGRGTNIAGFGDKWECDWIGFVEYDLMAPTNDLAIYRPNGGGLWHDPNGGREYHTGESVKINYSGDTPTGFEISKPGGMIGNCGSPMTNLSGIWRFPIINRTDKYGRATRFIYSTNSSPSFLKLTTMLDYDGNSCTLAYTNSSFPRLITSVTDPYNRTARFFYDSNGMLTNIVDMAGLSSWFEYDTNYYITNMHTPYGATGFEYFSGPDTNYGNAPIRSVRVTEATGQQQLFHYRDVSPVDGYRSGYHWDRRQYEALSEDAQDDPVYGLEDDDFEIASWKHWLHATVYSGFKLGNTLRRQAGAYYDDSIRANEIVYDYVGSDGYYEGDQKRVSKIYWGIYTSSELELPRNAWGRPTNFTYSVGNQGFSLTCSYTNIYDADGRRLLEVWGPNGEQVRGYGYDSTLTNLLVSVTNAAGYEIHYTHDSGQRVTSVTHPGGMVTTNFYYTSGDQKNFLKTTIDEGYRTNHFGYEDGNLVAQTNAMGLVTTYTWDNLNRLTSIGYPDDTTVSNVYDKLDLVAKKDRLGQWTYFGYNDVRQLVAVTNANEQVTQYDYCGCGSPSQITEWNGTNALITTFYYDMAGRLTNTIYPDGYMLSYTYDDSHLIQVEDSSGRRVTLIPGGLLNQGISRLDFGTSSSSTTLWEQEFDKYGRVKEFVDGNGTTTTNAYDVLGRLTARRLLGLYGSPAYGLQSFAYDALGLTQQVNELGYTNWFVRDTVGRLTRQTNANDEVLHFTYNASGQLLTLTDGEDQTTTWKYDQYGRVTNKLDQAGTEIFRYNYDANDQLTNRWTKEKSDTFYAYDPVGNLTNVDYPGSAMDIALDYDAINRLTEVIDVTGTTAFTYTDGGQLLSENGPWSDDTVTYGYTARRRTSLSLLQPNGSPWTQSYGYDHLARLTNVTSGAGAFSYTYEYGYLDAGDRVDYLQFPGGSYGFREDRGHDDLARLTSTKLVTPLNSTANLHEYSYNLANQRTQQVFTADNYVNYTYDPIGQLKSATGWEDGGTVPRLNEQFGYDYDAAWNLNHRTNGHMEQTFSVNNRNELTGASRSGTLTVAGFTGLPKADYYWEYGVTNVAVSGTGLTSGDAELYYDGSWAITNATLANGNNTYTATAEDTSGRTAQDSVTVNLPATVSFEYDANGNLTNDGQRVFEYDYENQLTTVYVEDDWKSEFEYDAFGRRRVRHECEWSGSTWITNETVRYVYDGMLVVQERDANNLARVSYTRGNDLSLSRRGAGGIGGLLARTDNGQLNANDPNAHAYYHADGNGNITCMVNTNGAIVAKYHYDPYGNLVGKAGPLADENLYRFNSKEWHANAGLYYYGYRYYEPNLQRWLNTDPIQERGGLNLYGYVAGDPINRIDSWGLIDCAALKRQIQQGFNRFNRDSDLLRGFLNNQFDTLGDLYLVDRLGDAAFALTGNLVGKSVNSARIALTSRKIRQGGSLGVDLARGGSLTGPGLSAGATYQTAGAGGAIAGPLASKAVGSGLNSAAKKFARQWTTSGVQEQLQETVNQLNGDLNQQHQSLKNQSDQYRKFCE